MAESLTIADVERIAALARIALTPDETELYTGQLAAILAYVDELRALDTSGVPPTSHALSARSPLREDEPRASLPRDEAVAAAPDPARASGLFRVPRVIGG
jgi:aspartyl-tRNA(Asn)/glutamyl-tRNA(Gln) amidotransferase subunit C